MLNCQLSFKSESCSLCPTVCNPMDYTVHGILQARILEWVVIPFSRGSTQSRDRTQDSHIAGGFFTSWTTREAQEYWIFPSQESNQDLLHCRQVLYQLSYQGSPIAFKNIKQRKPDSHLHLNIYYFLPFSWCHLPSFFLVYATLLKKNESITSRAISCSLIHWQLASFIQCYIKQYWKID